MALLGISARELSSKPGFHDDGGSTLFTFQQTNIIWFVLHNQTRLCLNRVIQDQRKEVLIIREGFNDQWQNLSTERD